MELEQLEKGNELSALIKAKKTHIDKCNIAISEADESVQKNNEEYITLFFTPKYNGNVIKFKTINWKELIELEITRTEKDIKKLQKEFDSL